MTKSIKVALIVATLSAVVALIGATVNKRSTERVNAALKKYGFVSSKEELVKGLVVKDEDNSALFLPKLREAVAKYKARQEASGAKKVPWDITFGRYSNEVEIYELAKQITDKKGWYLDLDYENDPQIDVQSLRYASCALLGAGVKKGAEGKFKEGLNDLSRSVKLAKFLSREPSVVGQFEMVRCSAASLRAILAFASSPGRSKQELLELAKLAETVPEVDLGLAMKDESFMYYQILTGRRPLKHMNVDALRPVWAPAVADYIGTVKVAFESNDLDLAAQAVKKKVENNLPLNQEAKEALFYDYSMVVLTARKTRQLKLMVIEAIRAATENRLPKTFRDWTGSPAETTFVGGTADRWIMASRGSEEVFNEPKLDSPESRDSKDIFVTYDNGQFDQFGN